MNRFLTNKFSKYLAAALLCVGTEMNCGAQIDCGTWRHTVYSNPSLRCSDFGLGGDSPRCVNTGDNSMAFYYLQNKLYCDTPPGVLCVEENTGCPCVRQGNMNESDRCGCTSGCGRGGVCSSPYTCGNYPGRCGSLSNGCTNGGTISCGCGGGQCCVGTTCNTPYTCANYPNRCGSFSNNCGGSVACACGAGKCCMGTTCNTRYTCAANYPGRCGTFSDNCGGTITCGCGSGQCCMATWCNAPYTCAANYPNRCGSFPNGCDNNTNITCSCAGKCCNNTNCGTTCPLAGYVCDDAVCRREVMRVKCSNGLVDRIAGHTDPAESSRMYIRVDTTNFMIGLVDRASKPTKASCINVQVPNGASGETKALRKMP